jgi:hypothetical protein
MQGPVDMPNHHPKKGTVYSARLEIWWRHLRHNFPIQDAHRNLEPIAITVATLGGSWPPEGKVATSIDPRSPGTISSSILWEKIETFLALLSHASMRTKSMTMSVSGGTRRRLTPLGPHTSTTSSQVHQLMVEGTRRPFRTWLHQGRPTRLRGLAHSPLGAKFNGQKCPWDSRHPTTS